MSLIEKKYQLFISSTFTDLKDARQEVIKVFLNMYHIPIGMEMFSADNAEQWETIQETIDDSDYYILLVGHRYGSITKEGISYTEKEYDYAISKGIPVYAYIRNRDVATLPSERENDSALTDQLDTFIEKVQMNSTVEFWTNPTELGQKVSVAMGKAFARRPRIGWVKADRAASPEILQELATLSRINRELTEKVARLEAADARKPDLSVLFNGEESISIKLAHNSFRNHMMTRAPYEYPNDLRQEAHMFYTEREVARYNTWFDNNQDAVNEYNKVIQVIERAKENLIEVSITIMNNGTVKANDIRITLEFENVIVKEKAKPLPSITYPEHAPKHPAVLALEAYERGPGSQNHRGSYNLNAELDSMNYKLISAPYHINVKGSVEKPHVDISLKSLLHTKGYTAEASDNIYILPVVEGESKIKVTIMCEEFTEPVEYSIPLIVEESPATAIM